VSVYIDTELMEHIPSFMTKFTHTTITKPLQHPVYKIAVLVYIIYFIFSPNVFAQTVQAPDELQVQQILEEEKETEIDPRVEKIEAYYKTHNLPLAAYAQEFVDAADTYGIDWRLLPAIGFIESTGGKFACKTATYSPFGWGSCKINFDSYEHAIEVTAMNLGGHNPRTAHYYKDKTLKEKLYAYNSVIPTYRQKILREMEKIEG